MCSKEILTIRSESTPNTEMILISDIDLVLLRELNNYGSVKNLKDRRKDLYFISKNIDKENKE